MGVQPNAAVMKLDNTPLERRERRPVTFAAYAERQDRPSVEVLLLDLSYEGCGVETPVNLEPGELLKLCVLRRGIIEARVRWCRGGKAGLVFEGEEPEPEHHWSRRSERIELTAEVSMRRLGKISYREHVFDVSPDGCKVELVDLPRVDEHVLVKFDGLEARIRSLLDRRQLRGAALREVDPSGRVRPAAPSPSIGLQLRVASA